MKKDKYKTVFLEKAHKRSIFHSKELGENLKIGCFHCLEVFGRSEIIDWTDKKMRKAEPPCDQIVELTQYYLVNFQLRIKNFSKR